MEALLVALASGLAIALAGEAYKSGLGMWFRQLDPDRAERCPVCGSDQLDRRMARWESLMFLPLVGVWSLAFTATILAGFAAALAMIAACGALLSGSDAGFGGFLAVVCLVALIGWLFTRWLRGPIVDLRGRPPVRCRRCGHAFGVPS